MIGAEIPKELLKERNNDAEIVMSDEEEQENDIGPQIPQHIFQQKQRQQIEEDDNEVAGPQIPQYILEQKRQKTQENNNESVGPQMPEHILRQKKQQNEDTTVSPQIPQHILQQKIQSNPEEIAIEREESNDDDYTPALPPDLIEQRRNQQKQPGRRRAPIGPSLPSDFMLQQPDEDDTIGPALPKDYNPELDAKSSAIYAIEERARQSREAIEKKKDEGTKVERPEWMLAPPEVDYLKSANSSRSRQFSNKPIGDIDSSSWTETPADKERKLHEGRSGKRKAEESVSYSAIDTEKKRAIEEYNMHARPMSLLEMHQQKKKKSKEPTEDVTKRPFDREKDLLAPRRMNSKQKKEMLKQSNQFGDRFGYGRSSFL
ncbi:hypothetical protein G6F66_004927 [Rhizopus arrhizus]|nr:hypothetical protein G6F66_004927 [Rhizopus arrhizus]